MGQTVGGMGGERSEGANPLNILMVEDDPRDAELVSTMLEDEGVACEMLRVQTRAEFVAALEEGFDLVLADYSLPAFDGLSALEIVREGHPDLPFILVSGTLGEEAAIEAMKSGATDYVLKQRMGRLVPAVRRAMREVEERSERKRAEEALKEVREAERDRLARDLHDMVLQDLTYALQTMQLPGTDWDEDQHARLEDAVAALRRSVRGLRVAISDLRLEATGEGAFVRSLESLVDLNRQMNPECEIELDVSGMFPEKLPEQVSRGLLRIIREALTNARRHSEAGRVSVNVGVSAGKIWAEVSDDGRGFGPETHAGMGTRGMRERARALGAGLKIESQPGRGTKVRLELTLERGGEELEQEIRVLLVEDHASFRQAAASVLEGEPGVASVGQAGSLTEARQMLGANPVDVAIIDLGLPDGYGGDLIRELRAHSPQAQALVLSASLDRAETARAVESGAAGVLHKSADMSEVADAVRRLRAGETLLPLEEVVELLRFAGSRKEEEHEARRALAQLTSREKEVLQALATGLDGPEIAKRLHISDNTERGHVASIFAKLGVHSRLQALVFALRHGAVSIRR